MIINEAEQKSSQDYLIAGFKATVYGVARFSELLGGNP
jgi:hypothetical protein